MCLSCESLSVLWSAAERAFLLPAPAPDRAGKKHGGGRAVLRCAMSFLNRSDLTVAVRLCHLRGIGEEFQQVIVVNHLAVSDFDRF